MTPRCAWTHESGPGLERITLPVPNRLGMGAEEETFFVRPEHEADLRRFINYVRRYGRLFLLLIVLLSITTLGFALAENLLGVGISVLLTGIVLIIFPFATPETVKGLGLSRAIKLTRILGGVVAALGLFIALGILE